jgi:hypothetical protein
MEAAGDCSHQAGRRPSEELMAPWLPAPWRNGFTAPWLLGWLLAGRLWPCLALDVRAPGEARGQMEAASDPWLTAPWRGSSAPWLLGWPLGA